jgi:transketolase
MDYKSIALEVRKQVLKMIHKAQTSHIGSNFSVIDLATVLYENVDLGKDQVIWSKGWAAATVYTFLARKGIIPFEDLDKFCSDGESRYIGLTETDVKGIDAPGGSMGYGLPFGVGYALAKKLKGEEGKIYVIMSDGEQPVGTTWESAALAAHHKLGNLALIIDKNGFEAMGTTKEVLDMDDLTEKWRAFGWNVQEVDGHDYGAIELSLDGEALGELDVSKPQCIIANTVKGKGVSFMEGLLDWHYKNVSDEDYEKAMLELS